MKKKLLAAILLAATLLACAAPALAAGTTATVSAAVQYRAATTAVNVRSGPNSSTYGIIGSLSKGEMVRYNGQVGSWSQVVYKGMTGYVFTKYLFDPIGTNQQYRVATQAVNVRTGPSSSKYPARGFLSKGEQVQYLAKVGSWSLVYYKGDLGYVFSKYLASSSAPESPTQYRIATLPLNVRTGPGTKYAVLGYLDQGETVQYLGKSGNWAIISYKGRAAYAYAKYLSAKPSLSNPVTAATQDNNLRLQLVVGKSVYNKNEPIDCYAVLTNISSRPYLVVGGTKQLVYFPIRSLSGNNLFNGVYYATREYAETWIYQNKPMTVLFAKTGSVSPSASAAFAKEYFANSKLILPPGTYELKAEMQYSMEGTSSNGTLSVGTTITVKD